MWLKYTNGIHNLGEFNPVELSVANCLNIPLSQFRFAILISMVKYVTQTGCRRQARAKLWDWFVRRIVLQYGGLCEIETI